MVAPAPPLSDLLARLEEWYPASTADSWDEVGLVCGEPDAPVRRVLLAVDPAPVVADEAVRWGADLLLTHHPLLLRGVHSVAATTPKGRTVSTLVRAGCALLSAHTNADKAHRGVSHALADALGLRDQQPLVRDATGAPVLDKLTCFVPREDAATVRAALAAAGAGQIGAYDQASFSVLGEGRFRPREGARPHLGRIGVAETVAEERVEVVLQRRHRPAVVRALVAAHPYEEPAYDVVEVADPGTAATGTGRVGDVEPTTLRDLAARVAAVLPATAHGVRVAGDPDRPVRRVALCGERATSCSTTCAPATRTSTSPATCATIPPRSSSSTTGPPWSTWPTGPRSGPGCRCSSGAWSTRWAIRWRSG